MRGTDTPSTTGTGNSPSTPPAADGPARRIAREFLLLEAFLPRSVPDLSPEAVARWRAAASERAPRAFPGGEPPCRATLSLFEHAGDVRAAIVASKYSGRPFPADAVARRLAEALRGAWKDRLPDGAPPTIVPVPVHPLKYFRRGFNLPAQVAASLARRLGWPYAPLVLHRTRERVPQAGLPGVDRQANVRGAFHVPEGKTAPCRVLLLDDVLTTGATAHAAASALKTAGADHIVVVAIARAVP